MPLFDHLFCCQKFWILIETVFSFDSIEIRETTKKALLGDFSTMQL